AAPVISQVFGPTAATNLPSVQPPPGPTATPTAPPTTGAASLPTVDAAAQSAGKLGQQSQFGDPQLTAAEAEAACGPAAAVRFAQLYGRNPTLREATDMATSVGWNQQQGMAGLNSEKALFDKMNIPSAVVNGANVDQFVREAQTGNPVVISTPG